MLWTCAGFFIAALCVLALATPANATTLPVNGVLFPVTPSVDLGGTVLATNPTVPFVSATFIGTLTSTVEKNDLSNPFDPTHTAGDLTFTYVLSNSPGVHDAIHRLALGNFTGFLTDVSYVAGLSTAPTLANRLSADVIGFSFKSAGPGALNPGTGSDVLVIHTNATNYAPTLASVIDGSTASVSSYAPTTEVRTPEPGTWVLLALGGVGLFAAARRNRQTARS